MLILRRHLGLNISCSNWVSVNCWIVEANRIMVANNKKHRNIKRPEEEMFFGSNTSQSPNAFMGSWTWLLPWWVASQFRSIRLGFEWLCVDHLISWGRGGVCTFLKKIYFSENWKKYPSLNFKEKIPVKNPVLDWFSFYLQVPRNGWKCILGCLHLKSFLGGGGGGGGGGLSSWRFGIWNFVFRHIYVILLLIRDQPVVSSRGNRSTKTTA